MSGFGEVIVKLLVMIASHIFELIGIFNQENYESNLERLDLIDSMFTLFDVRLVPSSRSFFYPPLTKFCPE